MSCAPRRSFYPNLKGAEKRRRRWPQIEIQARAVRVVRKR
jgi:hypothetical protein